MQMNLQEEIQWIATIFQDSGHKRTALQINKMSKNLSIYKKYPRRLDADIDKLVSTFDREYIRLKGMGNENLRTEYLLTIQTLLETAIQNSPDPKKMLAEILPFVLRGIDTSRTEGEMSRILGDFNDERFLEINFYISLFIFMLHVEGEYFPAIKTLYALKMSSEGKNIDFKVINKMSYASIKKELGRFGEPLVLVYDDIGRKLRNAVAHANFRYDKGKLICWNTDPRTRREIWKKEFTFDELTTTLIDIYGVAYGYINWYLIRHLLGKIRDFASPQKAQ